MWGGKFFGDPHDFQMGPKEEKGQKKDKLTIVSNKCGNFHQKRVIFGYFGFPYNFSEILIIF